MLLLLLLGLEGLTEVDTDPRQRFVSFKVITINESYVCTPSGYSTREQLARGCFFEGLQKNMQNKNDGTENKIMLGDLNCAIDKIDRDGENKTQRLYKCYSNYALHKLIVDNEIEDLWRRENPGSPEFICYDRFFDKDQCRPSILIFSKEPIVADELWGIWVLPSS